MERCLDDERGVYVGNAHTDGSGDRGWLLGHFKSPGDLRHSTDVEIKWSTHPAGDTRAAWVTGERRTALLVLISGRFRVELRDRSVLLSEQGDYVIWGPGVDHSYRAEEESVVMTVRWPSVPGYANPADARSAAGAPGRTPAAGTSGRAAPGQVASGQAAGRPG